VGSVKNASQWRIELTKELAKYYEKHENIKMIVLGGSPSKNLSDAYSDLDIIVYWDKEIDFDWLENPPLEKTTAVRKKIRKHPKMPDTCLEHYYFGNLKADFGHVTMKMWEEWYSDIFEKFDPTPYKQKSIDGFIHAVPIYGEDLYNEWRDKVKDYPEQLITPSIHANLRFLVEGCLMNQGYARGDKLFYYDGLVMMLKSVLGILAAMNKLYYGFDEPRWLDYTISLMKYKPENLHEKINNILEDSNKEKANDNLEKLIVETFDLVKEHTDFDISRIEEGRKMLAVLPCEEMPKVYE